MIGIDPTWLQTIRQQMQQYQQATDAQIDAATYHQAMNYPRNYGVMRRFANPLLSTAQNSATALFGASNPEAGNLLQAYFAGNAPGGNTIGLPGGDMVGGSQVGSPDELIAALLSRQGMG